MTLHYVHTGSVCVLTLVLIVSQLSTRALLT